MVSMFLRDYEQRLEPQLSSELGEPILRCIALNAATMSDRMESESLSPFWRPSLIVNGQPHIRLPQTMFLILTPTRVLVTGTKRGMTGYRPVLASPILTLLRGDAEMTAVQDGGLWLYRLKSRAQSAELDLELSSGGRGIAAELAAQLREFSVTQPTNATPGLTAPPEPTAASQLLDNRRRWLSKSYRRGGVVGVVLALLCFGFGGYQVYGYHYGTPTKATIVSCGGGPKVTCQGTWTLDGETQTGRIWGNLDHVQDGSTLDIGVYNGWAFAPRFPKRIFIGGAVCVVMAIFLFIPERRGRRPAGSARRGRHASP
jgi:hypothetical protein